LTYRYGKESEAKLADGVVFPLVQCAHYAIDVTEQDFCLWETRRSVERALALQAAGASRNGAESHHVADINGRVHALDAVPWIAGGPRWIDAPGLVVAKAWHRAATKFNAPVTWGGVWDRLLASLDPTRLDEEVEAYVARFRSRNRRRPLVDLWHYEVPR
jgi:hypothetical protein